MTENKEHDKLFADLDALTEQQIEVGLAADVWNERVRPLVQHYLYDLKLKRVEAAADRLNEIEKAVRLAVSEAIKAKTRANEALIIGLGAMVAAMAGALIAFLALRKYGFQPPW
jgi:predicted nucleic acid-binding protein